MDIAQALGTDTAPMVTSDTRQYLTFFLADAEYGVDILRVQKSKAGRLSRPSRIRQSMSRG